MIRYTIKRLILALITTVIVLSLTFILMKLLPFPRPIGTDVNCYAYYMDQVHLGYVKRFTEPTSGYGDLLFSYNTPGDKNVYYFYQTPVMEQYFRWVGNIITKWDWGTSTSIAMNVKASVIIASLLPTSMKINILSVIVSVPLGIILGIIAALNKNKPVDHVISTSVMVFISIPSFVLITLVIYFFAYNLHWLPTQWPNATDPTYMKVQGYIIPVAVLSFGSICISAC